MKNLSSKKTYLRQLIHYLLNLTKNVKFAMSIVMFPISRSRKSVYENEDDHIKL